VATLSAQFFLQAWQPGDPDPTPYTVAGGFEAVLTDVQIQTQTNIRVLGSLALLVDGITVLAAQVDGVGALRDQWVGRIALAAGAVIQPYLTSSGPPVVLSVSGYLYS
jgi:hypothetical protein